MRTLNEAQGQAFYRAQVEAARRLSDDELVAETARVANDLNEARRLVEPFGLAELEDALRISEAEREESRSRARRLVDALERTLFALQAVAEERARAKRTYE
jgi:hypothetical protein